MAIVHMPQLLIAAPETWAWQLVGACRKEDSELFFHPEGERGSRAVNRENAAKTICARCPVLAECSAHALAVHEPYGVWGGMTEHDRDEVLAGRRPRPAHPALGLPNHVDVDGASSAVAASPGRH
jgi:WhiB family transcriptional regulator, redox-sensing transcriptional regulator